MKRLPPEFKKIFGARARSGLRVLVLVDPLTVSGDDPNFEHIQDPDTASMEHHIIAGLRSLKHHVDVLAFHLDTRRAVEQIQNSKADVAFNVVELVSGERRKSIAVPAVLDLLGIPY